MDYGDKERPPEVRRMSWRMFWILFIVIVLFTVWLIGGQVIWFWLNVEEFGELFTRPFYFETLGGFILAAIALLRVDFRNRRSITWWFIRLILRVFRSRGEILSIPPEYLDFTYFRLSPVKFALWQITKVIVGMTIFANIIFGMAVQAMLNGWESNITKIPELFTLPFATPPLDMTYAQQNVVPLAPVLTLLISPILMVLGVRLILLVGFTHAVKVGTSAFLQSTEPGQQVNVPLATIEGLIALALTWTGVNFFFPSYIDYNTKYIIGGLFTAAALLAVFAFLDRSRRKRRLPITRRAIVLRIVSVLIVVLFTGSLVTVQNSIADARKVEWMGPYTTQEISVNRYLAQLDAVNEMRYNFSITPVAPERIKQYVANYSEILSKVRLWDLDATNAKLKPEIGLIPYVDFEDSDILRFNNTLYWSASMKPVLPRTVESGNRWFLEHMYYTHVPNGFLLLDGHEGTIVNSAKFFQQRQIYYGEGGLLTDTWAAYPLKSGRSAEVGDTLYNGTGGIDISPPLSWIFDSTFLVSFPDDTVHALRYKDVYDRMRMLYPYFMYNFAGKLVDMYPVTDGKNTYWAMPLIVGLDGGDIPWSTGKPLLRQVGYALIDIYNGNIQIIVTGNDFFSQLFKTSYGDYVSTEMPDWLKNQTRYPEELFEWRVSMYNYYHVSDPATFISAKDFFEVPAGLDTYYVISKPPLFNQPEFLGILSLQLRDSPGRNLAGYAVVRNDYSSLGQIIFYQVPLDSSTKLLGPTAVLEALQKDKDYAERKTLLSSAGGVKEGDNILYRIGDQDVYFIPVYTAKSGGVITQMGLVAAVGASFTGQTFIGLGSTPEEAFSNYLAKLGGVEAPPVEEIGASDRRAQIEQIFLDKGLKVVEPKEVHPDIVFLEGNVTYASAQDKNNTVPLVTSFVGNWSSAASEGRILRWRQDSVVNYGMLVNVNGIVELHYISISFEKPS